MMDSPKLYIIDVGHGNASLLLDTKGATFIDAGSGSGVLLDFLKQHGIKEIANVLISHADKDHIAGLLTLLLDGDISISNVYINPDSTKKSTIWYQLRSAVKYARENKGTVTHTELTSSLNGTFDQGEIQIEILAPTPELAMSGPGGEDLQGRKTSTNAMSVVVRIKKGDNSIAILPGDIEGVGLDNLIKEKADLDSKILVFPHHGGEPKVSDIHSFTKELCGQIKPSCVIFSNGRGKYRNPRVEIIETICDTIPDAWILCTQLSQNCAPDVPVEPPDHLNELPSAGRLCNHCCAGTIEIEILDDDIVVKPKEEDHRSFISSKVPDSLCLK